jgi:hypothetical protein
MAILMLAGLVAPHLSHATLEVPNDAQMHPLQLNGLYRFTQFKEVKPLQFTVNGKTMRPDGDDITYTFHQHEPVRAEFLPNGIVRITRGSSPEEAEDNPSRLEVRVEQFQASDLEPVTDNYGRDLDTLYIGFTSERNQIASRGGHFYGGSCRISNWGTGQCVNYIKHTEGIRGTLGNGGAVAFTLARKYNYRRTNCESPSLGTIASWPGHVAKWDGRCWRTWPAIACNCNHGDPGRGRPLLCVIK